MECWGREKERKAVASLLDWHKNQILKDALLHFESLIEAGNNGYFCMSAVAAAASYLTLKRLTFGGVLRSSKQGKLNVALSADKLEKFLAKGHKHRKRCALTPSIFPDKDMGDDYWGWRYEWPTSTIQTLDVHDHWRGAVEALANGPHERALVTIDPPYYSPKQWVETRQDGSKRVSKMTPAYGNHNPQADLDLCVDPLDAVLATGKAARIVLFNYWSEELHVQIVERVGANGGCSLFAQSNLGPLGGMNQAQQFHGRDIEAVWEILLEIGGKRMFQDHDALKQMELAQV